MKYLKAAFRYLVPYMLYGEILYLSLKGVKDKSIFMFNGLFGYYSEMSRYLAWGLDIFFIVAGLGAIVYGTYLLYTKAVDAGGEGFETAITTEKQVEYQETMSGNWRAKKHDVTVYDTDAISNNVALALLYFVGAVLMDVVGIIFFIVFVVRNVGKK